MIEAASRLYRRAVVGWVDGVRRFAGATMLAVLALTLVAGWYSVTHVAISTDTSDMLSPDLEYRRHSRDLSEAFPQFSDNLLIVIDADSSDLADDAAAKLGAALRRKPEVFGDVYDLAGDPFFRRNGLLYLDLDELATLSDRLAAAQPFLGVLWRDPSLRGLFGMLGLAIDESLKSADADPVDIGTVLEAMAEVAEAQADGRFSLLSWRRLMEGGEDDAKDRRRLILIQPALDFASLSPASAAMTEVRALARDLGLDAGQGVRVRLTGSAPVAEEELKSVADGMGLAFILSTLFVIGVLALGLRSARLVAATSVAMIAGLIWTAGFAFAVIGALNLISVAFAVLFVGLSVDFGIHFALRYREGIDGGAGHEAALRDAADGAGDAIMLSATASALAFFSFLPTDYLGLAELGLIAGMGMFIAVVANLTIVPAWLTLAPLSPRRRVRRESGLWRRAETGLRTHSRIVSIVSILLAVGGLLALPRAQFDFDPLNLKDPRTESVSTLFDLMGDSNTNPYSITVLAKDLDTAKETAGRLKALAAVKDVQSLADYVPVDQDDKLATIETMALFLSPALSEVGKAEAITPAGRKTALDDLTPWLDRLLASTRDDFVRRSAERLMAALRRLGTNDGVLQDLERRLISLLPARLDALRDSLQAGPVGFDDLPSDLRVRQIAPDGRVRVEVYPAEDVRDREALVRFVRQVRQVAPNATGSPVVVMEAGDAVVGAFLEALALAAIGIAALLLLVLRSLRDVALAFAPLVLATLLTVAASALLDLPFNFANVIVLPLIFGLGVSNGIHMVIREREEAGVEAAMATSTPRAVVFSALTEISTFASMSLSSHLGTASMGILLTIGMGLTLTTTVLCLPALMDWTVRHRGGAGKGGA